MVIPWVAELTASGMPARIAALATAPLQGALYLDRVAEIARAGSSAPVAVYIWGANGNGKTHMGSWLLSVWHAQALRVFYGDDEARARGWVPTARWATCNAITAALKNYSRDDFDFDRELREYTRPGVLMIDDLWPDRRTDADVQNITEIIETRANAGRRTVITGNHSPSQIKAEISRRLGDRMHEYAVIEFTGGSHRLRRSMA